MKSLSEMTLAELHEALEKAKRHLSIYEGCQDGSWECCYHCEVRPIELEIKKREEK